MKKTLILLLAAASVLVVFGCATPEQGDPNATKAPETKTDAKAPEGNASGSAPGGPATGEGK
jgi:PBP1b-binding outer membrane lipoprotein LpoB